MSLREVTVSAAVAAAFGLLLSAPGAAVAATGQFRYGYTGDAGRRVERTVPDPADGRCVYLPGVSLPDEPEGDSPVNGTDRYATMFTDTGCVGARYTLRPGGKATARLKLRSVRFDPTPVN